jgi:cell division protein FtsQ
MGIKKKLKRNSPVKKNRVAGALSKMKYLVSIALPVIVIGAIIAHVSLASKPVFPVNKVVFTGNTHLSDEELKGLAGLNGEESLVSISSGRVFKKLSGSPWIRSVSVRKEFPDRLHILVSEAEPFALLDMKGHLFIVDDKGKMLEELKDGSMPFLPVISGNPFEEKEVFYEAINLAKVIKKTGLLSRKDHIEIIAHKPQEMALNLDGVVVKVGTGEYEEKLVRLMELEEEIKNRLIPVDYIDLRFENRVIVKPVNEVIR